MNRCARTQIAVVVAIVAIASGCTTTAPPPAAPTHTTTRAGLVDPRVGDHSTAEAGLIKRFDRAWQSMLAGELQDAERRFADISRRSPSWRPATLALAAIALERGDLARAEALIDASLPKGGERYLAAEIYRAELEYARGLLRGSYETYKNAFGLPGAEELPRERFDKIRAELFEQLESDALGEPDVRKSIAILRDALTIRESDETRLALANRLVETKRFDEARRDLEPLILRGGMDRTDVQAILSEIEVGKKRYEEAIARLDRLAKKTDDPRFARRLREVKQEWNEANMPRQYQRALASEVLSRADFAVLVYWKVAAVRFVQNLPEPPIAVDIAEVEGREEFVRALALRLFPVEAITRQAHPEWEVSGTTFVRAIGRLLTLPGTPSCASSEGGAGELSRAMQMIEGCGIDLASIRANPDAPLNGREASRILDAIDAVHESRKSAE